MNVLLSELKEGVLHLTLNRPEKANALSAELVEALLFAIRETAQSGEVSVVTLSGAGKSFCAGADTSEIRGSSEGSRRMVENYVCLMESLAALEKPFLIGVNGPAVGGGLGLVASGDMVLASQTANFQTPELKLGLFPFIVAPLVVPIIGRRRFFEMVYTGRAVSVETALEWGLVNEVTTATRLKERLSEIAAGLTLASPSTLRQGKRAVIQGFGYAEMGHELCRKLSEG